jgi:hypothetical protein
MTGRRVPTVSSDLVSSIAAKVAAKRRTGPPTETPPARPRRPYHEAAAVLAAYDSQTLVPLELQQSADADTPVDVVVESDEQTPRPPRTVAPLDALLADSVQVARVPGDANARVWSLKPGVRIQELRQLRDENRIAEALALNQADQTNPLDRLLRAFLEGSAPALTAMSREELAAAGEVAGWLREAGFTNLPAREEIVARFEWLALLQPFEHLAGTHFGGRVTELRILREYADVLPPVSLLGAARATVARVFSFTQKPPLMIFGPGGVGKSSLVARFILEHARAHEAERFPFAYLDFDRPEIAFDEPMALLVEAVRQIGVQYPDAREQCEALRRSWLTEFSPRQPGTQGPPGDHIKFSPDTLMRTALLQRATRDFVTLLGSLGVSHLPVLLVLDTFEEVQRRSDESVAAIWNLLEYLGDSLPRLRVVVVGRADVPSRETQKLPLAGLDTEAAVSYLIKRGVQDRAVALRLANRLGGSPLSLKLAAEMLTREGLTGTGELDITTREYFFLRVDDALIQRQLYMRILSYVRDEEVRRLAHPGLVLRRLTPELILNVLKGPCGLSIESLDQARELFQRLRREVALVSDVDDNTVKHRSDLRLLMVPLVRSSEAAKAREIDVNAVAFYGGNDTVTARAEEIYHRLWLDEPLKTISDRWVPGVESLLAPAIDEFSGARKAYLASHLGLEIDEETRQLAELEDWERLTERKAADLLRSNDPTGALAQLRARTDRSASSPLPLVEARALVLLERGDEEALAVLDEGIRRAIEAADRRNALGLATQAAGLAVRFERADLAPRYLMRFKGFMQPSAAPADRLPVLIPMLAMAELHAGSRVESSATPERGTLEKDALEMNALEKDAFDAFDAMPDTALSEHAELVMWAATMTRDPARLARVLRAIQITPVRASVVRQLAGELARFDLTLSEAAKEPPGLLARRFDLAIRPTLTETWSDYLLNESASGRSARETLATILETYGSEIPADVIDGVAKLPRFALGFEQDTAARQAPIEETRETTISGQRMAELVDALLHAFRGIQDFEQLLRFRLDRNLDAISSRFEAPTSVVRRVIETADAEGWLQALVAAALEARPNNPRIQAVASAMGVSTLASTPAPGLEGDRLWNPSSWRRQLSPLEGQICRVEAGGRSFGTGFLIGPDLILTADFVLSDVIEHRIGTEDVIFRFDYKADASGDVVSRGTEFRLKRRWLVARSPWKNELEGLGYALISVDGSPGVQPIGGSTFEAETTLRKWIELPPAPRLPQAAEGLMILHHPLGMPLKATMDAKAVLGFSADRTRLYHSVNTEPGSSGSPCFGLVDLQLLAMHIGSSESGWAGQQANIAVTMAAIVKDLQNNHGFGAAPAFA